MNDEKKTKARTAKVCVYVTPRYHQAFEDLAWLQKLSVAQLGFNFLPSVEVIELLCDFDRLEINKDCGELWQELVEAGLVAVMEKSAWPPTDEELALKGLSLWRLYAAWASWQETFEGPTPEQVGDRFSFAKRVTELFPTEKAFLDDKRRILCDLRQRYPKAPEAELKEQADLLADMIEMARQAKPSEQIEKIRQKINAQRERQRKQALQKLLSLIHI